MYASKLQWLQHAFPAIDEREMSLPAEVNEFPSRLHLEGNLEVWARRLNDGFCYLIEGAAVQLHRGRCSFCVGVTIVAQRQASGCS